MAARQAKARIKDGSDLNKTSFTSDVKSALREYLLRMEQECGLVVNKASLTNALNARGITVSKQTIEDIFNPNEDRAINFEVIVAICEIFGISITDILPNKSDPYHGRPPAVWDSQKKFDLGVDELPPRYYTGVYHCYYFRPTYLGDRVSGRTSETETQPLIHATLTLEYEQGITRATFKQDGMVANFAGSGMQASVLLEGTAKLLVYANQVQVNLRDDRGINFKSIMFPYIYLSKDVLYSQVAAMLNISTGQSRYPLLQKMAIFRKKINIDDDQVSSVVRGILSMSSNELLVEKNKFEKFIKDHPVVEQLPRKKAEYYLFYEDHLYTSLPMLDDVTFKQLTEEIMMLRNICSNPAIMIIREHERYNSFAKAFQKRVATEDDHTQE